MGPLNKFSDDGFTAELLKKTISDLQEKQEQLAKANAELERQKLEIQIKNAELVVQKRLVEQQRSSLTSSLSSLEGSYQELEQFAYMASHDLKSPLRTIANFAGLLQKRYAENLDAQGNEFLTFIVQGAENMNQVICDLLNYSRLGHSDEDFTSIDLNDVVELVKFNLHEEITSNQTVLSVSTMPTITANKSGLVQLFQNLIGNAIKFRRKDVEPKITIAVEELHDSWSFSVQDNGMGMDEKFQSKAFQPFQRLNQDRAGSGMGLAICKKIVNLHGGDISFKSTPNEGTLFTFELQKECSSLEKNKAKLLNSN